MKISHSAHVADKKTQITCPFPELLPITISFFYQSTVFESSLRLGFSSLFPASSRSPAPISSSSPSFLRSLVRQLSLIAGEDPPPSPQLRREGRPRVFRRHVVYPSKRVYHILRSSSWSSSCFQGYLSCLKTAERRDRKKVGRLWQKRPELT